MTTTRDHLTEWTVHYIKHRDILKREIKELLENKEGFDFIAKTKDQDTYYLVLEDFDLPKETEEAIKDKKTFIIVPNKKSNVEVAVKKWEVLKQHQNLGIVFVNPDAKKDKRWIIFPFMHDKITEKKALKPGLLALFENVEAYR